ncbi:hypothetical protein [Dysgonomonas macrotermitis]|uniref:PI-PLC Y-box domain-containing protein n=1 Tax=Dysgonomonas macrotermitis TaxID=1346286 RepID=A0A1M4W7N1_9BACT|nr:hypothetical protein [Dysgonomonas macrotermitis]SHE77284.1 hypothetical protein SAMN05444362_102152 [Dysgonomonas macrotermitis]
MKKKYIISIGILFILLSCGAKKPKNFTLLYDGKDTGLETLIMTEGCYYDPSDGAMITFYKDGISIYQRSSKSLIDFLKWMEKGGIDRFKGKSWGYGRYIISGAVIINQRVEHTFTDGSFMSERKYRIIDETHIQNLDNNAILEFYPLEDRVDSTNWLLKKKWFWTKEAWDNRNK